MFLTHEIIHPNHPALLLQSKEAGAFVSFEGWVRNHHENKEVISLEYEAYVPLAEKEIDRILIEAKNRFAILNCTAIHRLGLLTPGDLAVWIGVTAAHRQDAYVASRFIIDEIKHRVPIWKKETYADGSTNWSNCTSSRQSNCASVSSEDKQTQQEPNLRKEQYKILSEEQIFARQKKLTEIGETGQHNLRHSHILVIGAGGLGCPALTCLAGAGLGKITILDGDSVANTNLHRQFLYGPADVGKSKATIAAEKLAEQFPLTEFFAVNNHFTRVNALAALANCSLILDCTDSLAAKLLAAKTAYALNKPLIQASLHKFSAVIAGHFPGYSPACPRCVWAQNPDTFVLPTCEEAGILGATTSIIGSLQAQEAINYIAHSNSFLFENSLLLDLLSFRQLKIQNKKSLSCPICSTSKKEVLAELKKMSQDSSGSANVLEKGQTR